MGLVEVAAGVRLHVQDTGTGPAVVFVAGFGLDHQVWHRQVEQFSGRHRVLCVDQRGHGASDKPDDGYHVEQLAADLVAALRDLAATDATLVGWSFGGQAAFHAAAIAPDVVARLVLVGSNGVRASRSADFPFGREPEPMLSALVEQETDDPRDARRATIASGFAGTPDPELLDRLVGISLAMPTPVAVACYRSMLTADLVADIPRVTQPVLQVIGADDPVHSAKGARWLAEQLPDARLVEIPGCGHYPMFEAPEAFDAALESFVG
jgi:pimeloyl-ACP methyl ester carboxylesterase